jgi:hypothetical protein
MGGGGCEGSGRPAALTVSGGERFFSGMFGPSGAVSTPIDETSEPWACGRGGTGSRISCVGGTPRGEGKVGNRDASPILVDRTSEA